LSARRQHHDNAAALESTLRQPRHRLGERTDTLDHNRSEGTEGVPSARMSRLSRRQVHRHCLRQIFGARSVAVCMGRFDSHDALAAQKPDALFADLSNMELVLSTFDEL